MATILPAAYNEAELVADLSAEMLAQFPPFIGRSADFFLAELRSNNARPEHLREVMVAALVGGGALTFAESTATVDRLSRQTGETGLVLAGYCAQIVADALAALEPA